MSPREGRPRPRLLIGTRNQGKAREIVQLLGDLPYEALTLEDIGIDLDVRETGRTFEENAIIKATTYAEVSGLLTLADDSGLEVDALGGLPGVYSARFGGYHGRDRERNLYLLRRLEGVPRERRTARFRCVIALAHPDGRVWTVEGSVEGVIEYQPRGEHGFGYDPIFFIPQLGKTMAELPPEEKNRISHRARAMAKARELLLQLLEGREPPAIGEEG